MSRRILGLLVIGACLFASLPAWAQVEYWPNGKVVNTEKYKKTPPWTVGISNASVSNDWRVSFMAHVETQLKRYPEFGKVYITNANDSPEKQMADIEDLLNKGIDVLILSAATDKALNPAVDKAMKKGVPVVVVDRKITTDNYVTFVANSDEVIGHKTMNWLAQQLGDKGSIVILSGVPGSGAAEARLAAVRSELKSHPNIKVLATEYVYYSVAKAKTTTASLIQKFGDKIDGIWTDGTSSNSGAIDAYVDAGLKIPPISGDDTNRYLKQWAKYKFNGSGASIPVWMGAVAVDAAAAIMQGLPVPHEYWVPCLYITNDTLKDYVREDMPDGFLVDQRLPEDVINKVYKKQ